MPLRKNLGAARHGFMEQIAGRNMNEVGGNELSGPRNKSTVGNGTPALLTSSS
jgi:hypothetical protein